MKSSVVFGGLLSLMASSVIHADEVEPTSPPIASGPQINQDREVDFDYCYTALNRHDDSGEKRITQEEYLDFCQDFGGRTECLGQLQELPLELLIVWNQLSCECAVRGGDFNCCLNNNAHIPITGVLADDQTSVEEQRFLRQVCLRTDQAIIAFCGPPPPPVIPPLPPGFVQSAPAAVPLSAGARSGIIIAAILLFLLCCCWRRRWFFVAGPKEEPDDSSSSSEDTESEDGGGMRHVITEEPPPVASAPPPEEPPEEDIEYGEPAADAMMSMAVDDQQDGDFGGTSYGRTVEEPEYEEEGNVRGAHYDQYDLPEEEQPPIVLNPVVREPPPPPPEDPYALEHYVPDGGIQEYEREGEWAYEADGGWTPEEKEEKPPTEWDHEGYERQQVAAVPAVDNRRARHLDDLGTSAVFAQLEEEQTEVAGPTDDMFDWVIRSTLNTLDNKADDLKGSDRGSESGGDDNP